MHHAIKNIYYFKDLRAVKQMLIMGANREMMNCNDYKPIDMISSELEDYYREHLECILRKQPLNIPCCQKSIPMIKQHKSPKISIIYASCMFLALIMLHLFVFPYKETYPFVKYINLLFMLQFGFFIPTYFKSPGFVEKNKDIKFYKLV